MNNETLDALNQFIEKVYDDCADDYQKQLNLKEEGKENALENHAYYDLMKIVKWVDRELKERREN